MTVVILIHPQEAENATIPELIRLSLPDSHILLLAFTAGAVAALGQVGRVGSKGGLFGMGGRAGLCCCWRWQLEQPNTLTRPTQTLAHPFRP